MIKLRSPLELKPIQHQRWELFFDTGELFSLETPFRDYLEQIRAALSGQGEAQLRLPPAQGEDDCVSGELRWGAAVFETYFERALSYFTLAGSDEPAMRRALERIQPLITIV